jgi:hypothetical protein
MLRPLRQIPCRRTWAWAVAIALALGIALIPTSALAIADPDTINIEDVQAFDGVLEANDLLVIVKYTLSYSSIPSEVINDAYLGRFLRGTTELRAVEPFAFNDKGYGLGVFSIYWNASQKSTDSIEFNNTNSEDYKLILQGKPGVFTGSVPTTTTGTIVYQDAADTKDLLFSTIQSLATALENNAGWSANSQDLISTTSGVIQLTSTGENYFSNAIPQLQSMVPDIFSSGTTSADFTEDTFDDAFDDSIDSFWDGNWVDARFDNLAAQLKVPKNVLTALFATFFMGLIAWFLGSKILGNTEQAGAFGLLTFAVTLPMAAAVDWFPREVVLIIALTGVLGIGFVLFLRRAGN